MHYRRASDGREDASNPQS